MARIQHLSTVATLVSLASTGVLAQDGEACENSADVLAEVAERLPEMQSNARKSRMGVVRIGSSAGIAIAYATDAGWSEDDMAALAAIRDAREPDANGATMPAGEVPGFLLEHGALLAEVIAARCPETEITELGKVNE